MVKGRISHPGSGSYGTSIPLDRGSAKKRRRFDDLVKQMSSMQYKEIGGLLAKVGYFAMPSYKAERAERERQIASKAEAYIRTPGGKEKLLQCVRQVLLKQAKEEAERQSRSPEFREQVFRILGETGFKQVAPQGEAFAKACKRAVEARIQQWIESTRGQETVAALKERAVADKLDKLSPAQRGLWIRQRLAEIEDAANA